MKIVLLARIVKDHTTPLELGEVIVSPINHQGQVVVSWDAERVHVRAFAVDDFLVLDSDAK